MGTLSFQPTGQARQSPSPDTTRRTACQARQPAVGRDPTLSCRNFIFLDGNVARQALYGRERREPTEREALAEWVGREILPHERELRTWLRRRLIAAADVEDVVQECYCRLAQLSDVSHITLPRAYLFTMARNLAEQQRKRARVVRIETMTDAAGMELESDPLSPDRFATARQELGRVQAALATLPERARQIFMMRKVEGRSQKEIAQVLGVSEAVVENEASRSLRAVLRLLTEADAEQDLRTGGVSHARSR